MTTGAQPPVRRHARVIGAGARTALGLGLPATAAAVAAGIAGFSRHPFVVDQAGDRICVAAVPTMAFDLPAFDRLVALAAEAAGDALDDAGIERLDAITITVALPEDRPGLPADLARRMQAAVADALAERCRRAEVVTVGFGHAGGIVAMHEGVRGMIASRSRLALIGGVDSYVVPAGLAWLEGSGRLHTPANQFGLIPGEAAGFCLFELPEPDAPAGGIEILAAAEEVEQAVANPDIPNTGEALSTVIGRSLARLEEGAMASGVITDMNGEAWRADEYAFAAVRHSDRIAAPSDFLAPADCWGDVGAASAALFAGLIVRRARKGADGEKVVICCSAFSGMRAAALFRLG